jgi:hypothetical protein
MNLNNQDENLKQNITGFFKKNSVILTSLILAFIITGFLYWPLYQKIPLNNSNFGVNQEVSKIELPLGDDLKEILNGNLGLPLNRHELCLVNRNGFRFFHADSNSPGVPFTFYTDDLNKSDFGKNNKLGSMAIHLYYHNGLLEDQVYRELNSPKYCLQLETKKLREYASSTIEYRYLGLARLEELNLGEKKKVSIIRNIVGGYFIDTSNSSAYIIFRWKFFLVTFVILFGIFLKTARYLLSRKKK